MTLEDLKKILINQLNSDINDKSSIEEIKTNLKKIIEDYNLKENQKIEIKEYLVKNHIRTEKFTRILTQATDDDINEILDELLQ